VNATPEFVAEPGTQHGQIDANPTSFQYYDNTNWRALLEKAKTLYHLHISIIKAFECPEKGRKEAMECLYEAKLNFDQNLENHFEINRDMAQLVSDSDNFILL
jgi:hypothetical protein